MLLLGNFRRWRFRRRIFAERLLQRGSEVWWIHMPLKFPARLHLRLPHEQDRIDRRIGRRSGRCRAECQRGYHRIHRRFGRGRGLRRILIF